MKTTVNNYKNDKYYPRVVKAVKELLSHSEVVAPVDVIIRMGNLSKQNYDSWKKGQVSYLEKVFEGNLSKANRILQIIKFHAHDLNMKPSHTVYKKTGKGAKHLLKFSKLGNPKLEVSYSTHYLVNSPKKLDAELNSFLEIVQKK